MTAISGTNPAIDRKAFAFASADENDITVIRIREILDPDLRQRIVAALAERRGCSIAAIPEWFELDDADFVDLLNDLREDSDYDERDPRA
jgi:hypothetical protein